MPHITFIHGLSNKPEPDKLHQIWRHALAKGISGIDLGDQGVTTTMVYWADVLYPEPDPNVVDYESTLERILQELDASGNAQIPVGTTDKEKHFLQAMRAYETRMSDAEIANASENGSTDDKATKLERIPLPWSIKKKIMDAKIRDAYLYLFNKEFSPRPGTTYRVQEEVRSRFINDLKKVKTNGPHIVVSHSMGTMVAYDCLKRVPGCPAIDSLMTMGSPLGIDEVQDCFKPEWTRDNGYPRSQIKTQWVNVYDHLDVVCGADPKIANDFCDGGIERIQDLSVTNEGTWRHSVVKYLAHDEVRCALLKMLGL
ncbi:hypothetical protein [Nitrosomonas sp. Nm33]|uniref:hypothetical protein n=1 Tax=Nitrosomonas sp. Nm33 TaxID=133724 RepID=UPI000895C968|nr:hypothetical protein [Nitrosomonas sp. Nm33]SDX87068.1 hypothetical protein SAMN05421755_100113 [Nitrosomonas sp. Nm33]